jgi:hypothetical protein
MADDGKRKTESRMSGRRQQEKQEKKQFSDFVRIHAINKNLIVRDAEAEILKEGVTRFGLELEEANGILLAVVGEYDIALVSEVEATVQTLLEQLVRRNKIGQKEFDDAVAIYKRLTYGSLSELEVRRRVKQMIEERSWRARKTRRFFGTRKWFRRI